MKALLRLNSLATLAALLLAGPAAHAQFGLPTRLSMGAGSRPYGLELADINGDGRPDAVTANSRTGTVGVLLNTTPAGATALSFGTVAAFSTGAGSTPYALKAADFNGDGRPDVAATSDATGQVVVLLNTTAAGAAVPSLAAAAATALPGAGQSLTLTAGDVNGDNRPDLVLSSASQTASGIPDKLFVLLNTTATGAATASFAAPSPIPVPGTYPAALLLADFSGDGKPDLTVSNSLTGALSTYVNTTAAGAATPSFGPAASTPLVGPGQYIALAAGDVNGDGKPDLATTARSSGGLRVLLNTTATGAATVSFAAAATFATSAGGIPVDVKLADMNGDNRPDALVANNYDSKVGVLLNTTPAGAAPASFAAIRYFAADPAYYYSLRRLAVADLNADGKPDVVGTSNRANIIGALRNTMSAGATTASFATTSTFSTGAGAFPVGVAVADLNGDGRREVLSASAGLDAVGILPNATPSGAATASFGAVLNLSAGAGSSPEVVAVADVNADGKPDVASANVAGATVWLNTAAAGAAAPTFAPAATFALPSGNDPYGLALADVNGDNRPDLLVASLGTDEVNVLLNTTPSGAATASFAARVALPTGTGSQPAALAVADVNGDSRPDLLVAASGTGELLLLLNTAAAGAAAPGFAAPVSLLPAGSSTSPFGVALVDLNGDGRRDVAFVDYDQSAAGVLLNTTATGATTASFGALTSFTTGSLSYPNGLEASDVNGDGRPDLIASLGGGQAAGVLLNTTGVRAATPSFGTVATYPTSDGTTPLSLAVGDLNGDNRPEVVVASYDTDELVLLPNQYVLAALAARPDAGVWAYPNPSAGRLTLHRPAPAPATPATLYDAAGRAVRTLPLPATPDAELDLSDLPAGLYLLRLAVDGQPVGVRLTRQ